MPDTFHRCCDRLFIDNAAFPELNQYSKAFFYDSLKDFNLHIAHQLHMDLLTLFDPYDMQFRLFFLQKLQIS